MDDYGIPISRSPSYLSTQYFPHFMITMVVIYVLGNGAVTMTLILCLTAVAVGLMIRDHVLGFGYSEFGSPQEVHAFDSGYKKGYLDGLRDNGGTSFHPHLGRRSNSNPILHGRQRLMGPPVVDRASLRMHMLHHSVGQI
ncbi:hypothetical protein EX30DRAFT_340036 [Ascodesmis nigricans]|uniref:Copper transporter n=1 Tax=Ascodesmis nigricans TaxID=341454 RepID=A0A4S2MZB0_9PEZI|nr:hypothetical protein EX30DRAFT_340036 [Ascodesmis nigricans]